MVWTGHNSYLPPEARRGEHWWKKNQDDAHGAIFAAVQYLDEIQQYRRDMFLHHLRLYSNRQSWGVRASDYAASHEGGAKIRLNVVKSAIDTVTAHIGTLRPRPMYLTNRGNYKLRQRGENLGKFQLGQFQALNRYILGQQIFRDAGIFGPGFEKFYNLNGRICSERVIPDELIFDDDDAKYGSPHQLFQHKEFPRETLIALYPGKAKEIEGSPRIRDTMGTYNGIVDPVSCIEAWHLPSGEGEDDGRHTICVGNATLVDEEWHRSSFPFADFQWSDPVLGWLGIGLAEELAPIQIEINFIAQKIQRLMTLATSFVWKEKGSGVGKIVNKDWAQYEYTGKPPIFQNVASVSAEFFHHLDRLHQRAFEIAGVSQMAASATNPLGPEASGEALRVFHDVGTKRFMHVARRWENFHMEAAKRIYEEAKAIYESGDKEALRVLVAGDKDVEEINFKSAYMEDDKYVMRPRPVNILPDEPAGKIETLSKLGQAIPEMAPYMPMLLTGIPDVEAVVDRLTAPTALAEKMVDQILTEGRYVAPYPSMDLQIARQVATRELLLGYKDNVPNEKLTLLRRFISQVDGMVERAEQEDRAQQMIQAQTAGPEIAAEGPAQQPTMTGVAPPAAAMAGLPGVP